MSLAARSGAIPQGAAAWVCGLLLAGVAIFSGSLYLLAATGQRALGMITPVGGLAFLAAWLMLCWVVLKRC